MDNSIEARCRHFWRKRDVFYLGLMEGTRRPGHSVHVFGCQSCRIRWAGHLFVPITLRGPH